jgi:hypothetical protein
MEIWVTVWCRRDVRRFRLDLSFDVAVSAGREMWSLAGGSRRSPLGADKASLPDPMRQPRSAVPERLSGSGIQLRATGAQSARMRMWCRGCYGYPA